MTEIMERGSADPWKSLQQLALPALCRVSVWFFGGSFYQCVAFHLFYQSHSYPYEVKCHVGYNLTQSKRVRLTIQSTQVSSECFQMQCGSLCW